MVKITVDLVRKKAEHHEKQLAPLQEISLHQEGIEKMEHIQDWCPKLRILLLQSNLIAKIENINKLKRLEYLNLAINNIERIENLEKCESLKKLDLTLNFIGELTSISCLQGNYNLEELYLNGNPCTDFEGYRDYVLVVLPQLKVLDSVEIQRSQQILARQQFSHIRDAVVSQQEKYARRRSQQRIRLEKEIAEKWRNNGELIDDEEHCKKFWNEKTEHSPEIRVEMERQTQLRKKRETRKSSEPKRERPMWAPDGRPYNINQLNLSFSLSDEADPQLLCLDIAVYKHLDTSLLDVDIQPNYVRVLIKNKIFQLCLPEEVHIAGSAVQRSQTTGHLVISMPKTKVHNNITSLSKAPVKAVEDKKVEEPRGNSSRREFLEIGSSYNVLDFTNITQSREKPMIKPKSSLLNKEDKHPGEDFVDNAEVPPLI